MTPHRRQAAARRSVVLLDILAYGTDLDSVGSDNELGGALAAQHLIDKGHRQLAMVLGEPWPTLNVEARLRGFQRQAALAGLPEPRVIACHTEFGQHASVPAFQTMSRLFTETTPDFTGTFVDSDAAAMGVLKACHCHHLQVPEQLALVSFDDSPEASFLHPSLTTLRQDFARWAEEALRLIQRRLQTPGAPPKQVAVPPRLIERESTGGTFALDTIALADTAARR